jgi:GDP-L-fucose synthase
MSEAHCKQAEVASTFSLTGKRVFVAGHRGMVGSAIVRRLKAEDCEVVTAERSKLNLADSTAVRQWMTKQRPDVVILAAAKVGGINANNQYPVDFLQQNLAIQNAVIPAAAESGVEKLLFLGSSCIYPRLAPQPISEEALLSSPLEPTNQWYAIAKIAGLKLCQAYRLQHGLDFISAMPSNLYGPGDNYHPEESHVLAAFIQRFHQAKLNRADEICIWGTGTPRRELMMVDDAADALIHVLQHYSHIDPINIGTGIDHSIIEIAAAVANEIGYTGRIATDPSRPDGMPRKLLNIDKLKKLRWRPRYSLLEGISITYSSFLAEQAD